MPKFGPLDSQVSPRFTGPLTFARLPEIHDLGDIDLAVLGVPFDTAATFRVGGRFGPSAIRAASVLLRPYNPNFDFVPYDVISCVDQGDIAIVPGSVEKSLPRIEAAVSRLVDAGIVPVLLGGDHLCTLAHLRATRGLGPVALIDFDAHTDAWDNYFGERYNHGTWVRRATEEGLIDPSHSIEIGLRGGLYGPSDWQTLRDELNLDYLATEDVFSLGIDAVVERIKRRVGDRPVFVSLDIDVVDPGYAPGTGTPEPGGPSSRDVLAILRGLRGIKPIGFDVMEVIPAYDPAGQTASLAAAVAFEMVSLAAADQLSRITEASHGSAVSSPVASAGPRQ